MCKALWNHLVQGENGLPIQTVKHDIRMSTGVIPVGSLGHSIGPSRKKESGHTEESHMLLWMLVLVLVSRLVFRMVFRERVIVGILFWCVKYHLPGKGHAIPPSRQVRRVS